MKKRRIVIATVKSWNIINANKLKIPDTEIFLIDDKKKLIYEEICEINPEYVFFIHWSWYISKDIFEKFECIVFHPAKVPFGRGGSPIQNLIEKGYDNTVISAIRVGEELDAGDVYPIRCELSLYGTADEILMRMSEMVCFDMIPWIVNNKPKAEAQIGDVVYFSRRKPEESLIDFGKDLKNIFNKIRMLDGEGYPNAYVNIGDYKISFTRASLHSEYLVSDVKIIKRGEEL